MDYIKIISIPQINFAHSFSAKQYANLIKKQENMIEITYIESGELELIQNGISVIAKKGDLLCNLYRDHLNVKASSFHSHSTACFLVEFEVEGTPNQDRIPLSWFIKSGQYPAHCHRLIDEIIHTKKLHPENKMKCAGLFLQLLNELGNMCSKEAFPFTVSEYNYIKKARRYIYEHINLPIKQKEIAEHLGITPEYLCTVFKKGTGETMMKFINRNKLENISAIMQKENIPLYQAAELYGFTDPNYVSKLYKQYYGISITDKMTQDVLNKNSYE